jgi:hypothetical protein
VDLEFEVKPKVIFSSNNVALGDTKLGIRGRDKTLKWANKADWTLWCYLLLSLQ